MGWAPALCISSAGSAGASPKMPILKRYRFASVEYISGMLNASDAVNRDVSHRLAFFCYMLGDRIICVDLREGR